MSVRGLDQGYIRRDILTQNNEEDMTEGVIEQRKMAEFEMSDKDLITVGDSWIHEAKPLHDEFLRLQKRNERYYLGQQLDRKRLNRYKAHIVLNKVFQSLETVVPRATRTLPAPMVSLPFEEEDGKEIDNRLYERNLEDIMLAIATGLQMPQKFKEYIRYNQLFYLGVFKFGYDEDTGIWVENLRPQRILVPPYMSDDYVIEYHEDTIKDLKERFPGKIELIDERLAGAKKKSGMGDGTRIGYYEITTDEFKFWKVLDLILDKVANPHYDFKNTKKNHWKRPKKDYVFTDLWNLGQNLYSQTTLVDQMITLQDSINKRKRQISDSADRANGVMVGYSETGVTKKDIAALEQARQKPDGTALIKGSQGGIQHFQGQLLQPYVFDDLIHTMNEVDNVFGTHSTTRGEKTPGEETFGGRQLLKESDQERIDELTQMVERAAEKLYNGFAQMIRIHFSKKEFVSFLGEDGQSVQLKIDKNIIKDGVEIKVRQGSTITKDKITLSREAIELWQMNAIDPLTLYERIGDPSPYKTAERLFKWTQAPETLFAQAAKELEKATKSDRAQEAIEGVAQAEIENRALQEGKPVPPYEAANEQHLAAHQDFWSGQEIQQLPQDIRNRAADHIEAEKEIVKGKLQLRKEDKQVEDETDIADIL